MLSYRTPQEFEQRFNAAPELVHGRVRVAAEDYLDAIGSRYVGRTPATAFLRLSESIDLQRVDPAQVRIPTTVVAAEGDWMVPPTDAVALAGWQGTTGHQRVLRPSSGATPVHTQTHTN